MSSDSILWGIEDFYGKYHLSSTKSSFPIPGSQVKQELERISRKSEIKRVQQQILEKKRQLSSIKVNAKKRSAHFHSVILLNTVAGSHIKQSENILNEYEKISMQSLDQHSNDDIIARFVQRVKEGDAGYIASACLTGYDCVNWQEPETGNTALHMAVSRGLVDCVQELCKHRADIHIRNHLGYAPLHQTWFHKKHPSDPAEMRKQDEITCKLLQILLGAGAAPDYLQSDGTSILHTAVRLGPIEAVMIILKHKANHLLPDRAGRTPYDIANAHKRLEVAKILYIWDYVKRALIHSDFTLQWKKFLDDVSVNAAAAMSAKETLEQLHLYDNALSLDRKVRPGFLIDDPLLEEAKKNSLNEEIIMSPTSLKTAESHVETRISKAQASKASGITSTLSDSTVAVRTAEAPRNPVLASVKTKRLTSALAIGSEQSGFRRPDAIACPAPRSSYADRRKPLPQPLPLPKITSPLQQLQWSQTTQSSEGIAVLNTNKSVRFKPENAGANLATFLGVHDHEVISQDMNENTDRILVSAEDHSIPDGEDSLKKSAEVNVSEQSQSAEPYSSGHGNTLSCNDDEGDNESHPPPTELSLRRISTAQRVALDGKFLLCTSRLSTASALQIARRTRDAPLLGTEEQRSLARVLTTTVRDLRTAEAIVRKEATQASRAFSQARPQTTPIGVYTPSHAPAITDRAELFSRLGEKSRAWQITGEYVTYTESLLAHDAHRYDAKEVMVSKSSKDFDVNQRRLFTNPELLPPKKQQSFVDEVKERIQTVSSTLRSTLPIKYSDENPNKITPVSDIKSLKSEGSYSSKSSLSSAIEETSLHGLSKAPPKPVVQYGAGRVTSTHMARKPLEDPWSTVRADYRIAVKI